AFSFNQPLYPILPQFLTRPGEAQDHFVGSNNTGFTSSYPHVNRQLGAIYPGSSFPLSSDLSGISSTQKSGKKLEEKETESEQEAKNEQKETRTDDDLAAAMKNTSLADNNTFDLETVKKHREMLRMVCQYLSALQRGLNADKQKDNTKVTKSVTKKKQEQSLYPTISAF
ncbi:hypothetical protein METBISCDRAFT_28964, partial [Metschnikowia bicuspidata]